jgi:hypothetical protein
MGTFADTIARNRGLSGSANHPRVLLSESRRRAILLTTKGAPCNAGKQGSLGRFGQVTGMNIALAELVKRFDSGSIRLPLMQRDYVWRPSKRIALLDSLYRRWPIGAFYVWQTSDDHPEKDKFGSYVSKHMDNFFGFLLDGQQRLTSLSLAIRSDANGDLDHRAFFDIVNETFYLGNSKKTILKRVENDDPFLVPLSEIVLSDLSKVQTIESILTRIKAPR